MKIASITETKNQLSALLDAVRHGETVLITDRDKPVARLEPVVSDKPGSMDGCLARLERNGIIRRAVAKPSKQLLKHRPPQAKKNGSILRALLLNREEER